ncbi:MAG: hypothetical protein COU11_00070 [Candidatus Harrisonbacteria bacterium CG10_big_fil_rev_8_21_14_0_10_49_15]|uniref:DUF5671 domain-containing protein n=1 Tax=Candidatus Harrisonbacteria bacterium CG10_big_fil_rev_8_21_14_0_10_49_15 TaxID=1974587 RepID=A0A2H0UPA6_9BACT|nr:MAG: hypothetical protein COU11_00070 [Candidatus Harrisonbacteria bacterium CG10_big_fil_rev_8_21_14_0_10_49_15]
MKTQNTPRDFFLYLFSTAAIYYIAISTITLLWQYINYWFPDQNLNYYRSFDITAGPMRWAVASLIIVFPVYVYVMRWLGKDLDKHPEKREWSVRRWLIYITLFITGATVLGDLVTVVYQYLGGDFTTTFALKALAVLIVASAVFKYYYFNLRREPGTAEGMRKAIIWASSVFIAIIVIGAFFVFGSPATARLRLQDQDRVNHLEVIQSQLLYRWQVSDELPQTLSELEDPLVGFRAPADPVTGEPYEYTKTGGLSFELCATFALPASEQSQSYPKPIMRDMAVSEMGDFWTHDAGRQCFTRTIDPELYPKR